jgi:hypothetical protein
MAKYQSSWYWNNAVQRIKTVELKVNNNFETVLDITDNAMESQVRVELILNISVHKKTRKYTFGLFCA